MVARYHSRAVVDHEAGEFIGVRQRELPEDIEAVTVKVSEANLWLPRLMADSAGGQHFRGPTLNQGRGGTG